MVEENGDAEVSSGQLATFSMSPDDALNHKLLPEARTLQRDSWVSAAAEAL